jgi:hypothetical protein
MNNEQTAYSALFLAVPKATVIERFELTRQRYNGWRKNGIPMSRRFAFAKLAMELGISVPQSFYDEMAK